jgi:branched-chain amino acid transport system permease protein
MILDLASYGAFFLTTALVFGLIALGLNIQWGQTGLFNVGIAGFVAIGAYTSALLTTPDDLNRFGGFGLPIPIGWAAAAALTGLAALFVGAVTLRLRADYLAITTFGVAITIQLVALNFQSLTGGPFGVAFIPRPFASLQENALAFNTSNFLLVAAITLVVFVALELLVRGPWGRVLRAIREDETAAAAIGKSARLYRLQAFALGGAIMGLAGAIQGHFIGFIAPDNYISALTFQVWAMLIVGGSGNNFGALVGAIVVWGLWSASSALTATIFPPGQQARAASLQIVMIGVLLTVILVVRPRGLLGERMTVSRFVKGPAAVPAPGASEQEAGT